MEARQDIGHGIGCIMKRDRYEGTGLLRRAGRRLRLKKREKEKFRFGNITGIFMIIGALPVCIARKKI